MGENIILTQEQLEAAIRFAVAQGNFGAALRATEGSDGSSLKIKWKGAETLTDALHTLTSAFPGDDLPWLKIVNDAEHAAEAAANKTFGELAQRP